MDRSTGQVVAVLFDGVDSFVEDSEDPSEANGGENDAGKHAEKEEFHTV